MLKTITFLQVLFIKNKFLGDLLRARLIMFSVELEGVTSLDMEQYSLEILITDPGEKWFSCILFQQQPQPIRPCFYFFHRHVMLSLERHFTARTSAWLSRQKVFYRGPTEKFKRSTRRINQLGSMA